MMGQSGLLSVARMSVIALVVISLVVTVLVVPAGGAVARTDGEAAPTAVPATTWAPGTVLTGLGIRNSGTMRIDPQADPRSHDLRVRAAVTGTNEPAAVLTVSLAQYDSRRGTRTADPVIGLDPVRLRPVRVVDGQTVYRGRVPGRSLVQASTDIPVGQSALLCIHRVRAFRDGLPVMRSPKVKRQQHGGDCVKITRRPDTSQGVNALLTGVLSQVRLNTSSRTGRTHLSYSARNLFSFQDRPVRRAAGVRVARLTDEARWQAVFGAARPVMEAEIAGRSDLVTIRLGRPVSLGGGRYRSRIWFPDDQRPSARSVRGRDLTIYSDSAPEGNGNPAACHPDDIADNALPGNADFVGDLRGVVLTAPPGRDHLRLVSREPLPFHWFISAGAGCRPGLTGTMGYRQLADPDQWSRAFGGIDPNSALVWDDGGTIRSLAFEQRRPRWNARTQRWVSIVKPLVGDLMPSQDSVDRFVDRYGRTLRIGAGHLFVDSTDSVLDYGALWEVDENFSIQYRAFETTLQLAFTLRNDNTGWMGMTFSEFMFPGDSIVAWYDADQDRPMAFDYYNPGIPTLPNFPAPIQDTNPILKTDDGDVYDNVDNISVVSSSVADGVITIVVQRDLITEDIFDYQIYADSQQNVVSAYNSTEVFSEAYNAQQPGHTQYGATRMIF